MEWISVKDVLPTKEQQLKNWKFIVGNKDDKWIDCAYYEDDWPEPKWNNGESDILPTHWKELPKPPTK